jgi:putative MATE family efflux protein
MYKLLEDTKIMMNDRIFLSKTVRIALPVAMQGMLNTVVNMIDTMMIGSLGATAIAAVGLANKVFFVMTLLVFGVVSGSGILAAQFWGNQDVKGIRKVLGLALLLSVGAAVAFFLPAVLCPRAVMRIFTTGEETIRIGASYLVLAAFSYPFIAVSNTYVAMLRAVGQVKAPVLISSVTILINIVLNYTLIFGKFGAPAMGVAGAAVATLTARAVEMLALLSVVYVGRAPIACRPRELFGYPAGFVKKFFVTSAPVIANEFTWGLGVTMYSLAYGRMGNGAVAAITVATTIQDIMAVLFQGLGAAASVILGNEMGAGKLAQAERDAKSFLILQFLLSVAVACLCAATRGQVIALYRVTGEVARDVSRCLLVFSLYMPCKMFNYANIVGVLRSGGDTRVCLFLDCSGVWLIGIPMAFLGGLVLKQPIWIVYAMVTLEEVYKAVFGYLRYRKKKWLRNLAVEIN